MRPNINNNLTYNAHNVDEISTRRRGQSAGGKITSFSGQLTKEVTFKPTYEDN